MGDYGRRRHTRGRVYFVTDTLCHTAEALRNRPPSAKRIAGFTKPFAGEAVEVYRLK